MTGRYLRQSTASQTRTVGVFVDDTDFSTLENGLTIANTDILIKKNGAASGAKNSGGATADGSGGLYHLTWDATDTATVGELSYSIKVAGALVVFGSYTVLEEAVYDALFAASANAWSGAAGSSKITGVVLVDTTTTLTNLPAITAGWLTAAGIASDAITADKIADGAIDAATFAAGAINAAAIASDAITDAKVASDVTIASVTGAVGSVTGSIGSLSPQALADVRSAVGLAAANLDTQLTTIDDFLDTEIAAIKAKTDNLPSSFPTNFSAMGINASGHISRVTLVDTTTTNTDMRGTDSAATAASLASLITTVGVAGAGLTDLGGMSTTMKAQVNTEVLDVMNVDTLIDGKTFVQSQQYVSAVVAGRASGAGTGTEVFKGLDESTTRVTVTVDSSGNRSDITYG